MITALDVPTHFGEATVSPERPQDRRIGLSPIEFKLSYINNLSCNVTIVNRSGLKFVLQPQFNLVSNKLILRVEIIIHHSVKADIQKLLAGVDDESSIELQVMKEAFILQVQNNKFSGGSLLIDYPVTFDQLRTLGGSFYFQELDCVISLNDYYSAPVHPYSKEGLDNHLLVIDNANNLNSDSGFTYSIIMVDSCSKYGSRYLNICNRIYKVVVTKDSNRKDGVYVLSGNHIENDLMPSEKYSKYYSYEEAEEELGLYKSIEDARTLGDAQVARKQEMSKVEYETNKLKIELQSMKHTQELQTIEKEKELHIVEMEKAAHAAEIERMRINHEHELKMAREQTKDEYEDKSQRRKNTTEILKIIPAAIAVISAIVLTYKAFKKA